MVQSNATHSHMLQVITSYILNSTYMYGDILW